MTGRSFGHDVSTLVTGLSILLGVASAHAEVLTVCPEGCDYSLIQLAIDVAADGDRVEVGAGFYSENLRIEGKAIQLIGVDGADVTVVDGGGIDRCLYIGPDISGSNEVAGLTFQSGYRNAPDPDDNAGVRGGGLCALSSFYLHDAAVLKCVVAGSGYDGGHGGGVYADLGATEDCSLIEDVVIQGNLVSNDGKGGGIYSHYGGCLIVSRCAIEHNVSISNGDPPQGAGVFTASYGCNIVDSVISNNVCQGDYDSADGCRMAGGLYLQGIGSIVWQYRLAGSSICGNSHQQVLVRDNYGTFLESCDNYIATECCTQDECCVGCGPGACCLSGTAVEVKSQYHCNVIGGIYAGPGTTVDDVDCDELGTRGACCLDGGCVVLPQTVCTGIGGQWKGYLVPCEAVGCYSPDAEGACCVEGNCAMMDYVACIALEGEWQGIQSECEGIECDAVAASCDSDCSGDQSVDHGDLVILLNEWGPCF
jgi:hypothetical protein